MGAGRHGFLPGGRQCRHDRRPPLGQKLDTALAILNGAIGDHLARTGNGLATEMAFARAGIPTEATGRAVVLVHGLMCTEDAWSYPAGGDYGADLQRDLGYTPLYLRYNSGRAIADNGAALAGLLSGLPARWPVPLDEIVLLGYSLGGLVIRSACHVGANRGDAWLRLVRRALYIGTPHRGAPLERFGRLTARALEAIPDPYTRLIADVGNLRSDAIKDLGDADLRHEDRTPRLSLRDRRHPLPLLPGIEHFLVAGALRPEPWAALLFGDAMVPVGSATDGACATPAALSAQWGAPTQSSLRAKRASGPLGPAPAGPSGPDTSLPPDHVRILPGFGHVDLARSPDVYRVIHDWCAR